MEAKYYTMTEEDICIGLEFEIPVYNGKEEPETYIETTFNCNTIDLFFKKTHGIIYSLPENCRIKHLDRQDIEECGWKIKKDFGFEFYEKNGFSLHFYPNEEKNICILMTKFIIKNKSELQKLMKQLNIQTNKR
jgi:hypothetical protein